jgi:type II secretory pathway component PulL
MPQLTFNELIEKYGEINAWRFLAEIERAANIKPRHSLADPEARLAYACDLQDQKFATAQASQQILAA